MQLRIRLLDERDPELVRVLAPGEHDAAGRGEHRDAVVDDNVPGGGRSRSEL